MSNFISYDNLVKQREQFRKSAGHGSSEFNIFDTQGHKYFKIFFYFDNGDESASNGENIVGNGLLAPTWLLSDVGVSNYYKQNTAWSYLKMNAEDSRAGLLVEFVNLLSNISSESPWYFSEISGLDACMERKVIDVESYAIEAARQKISIKCLPDSADDRIGTLLDLYKSVVWDWVTRREILPANLRKFDMGILIFETPNIPLHAVKNIDTPPSFIKTGTKPNYIAGIGGDDSNPRTSYKYLEFHNCEIDYNSTKSAYSTLNNKDGFSHEYTIDILFDDCYESRYNEFLVQEFGDFIEELFVDKVNNENELASKSLPSSIEIPEESKKYQEKQLKIAKITQKINNSIDNFIYGDQFKADRLDILDGHTGSKSYDKGFLRNAADQLISTAVGKVNSIIKRAVLGNIYTFSLPRIGSQLSSLANGNILGAVRDISEYSEISNGGNQNNETPNGNIFPAKKITPTVKYIGNIYKGNTIANNL